MKWYLGEIIKYHEAERDLGPKSVGHQAAGCDSAVVKMVIGNLYLELWDALKAEQG
jgi:hypothetical protein